MAGSPELNQGIFLPEFFMDTNVICKSCGAIDEYYVIDKGQHKMAYCTNCDTWIKNLPYKPPTLYFGKYKGRILSSMTSKEEIQYLNWMIKQSGIKQKVIDQIITHLKSL